MLPEIDALFTSVSIAYMVEKGNPIGSASSFFFEHKTALYLITNRHVVLDPNQLHLIDALDLRIHTNPNDLSQNTVVRVPLLDPSGKKLWIESANHPEADVVAIPLAGAVDRQAHFVVPFTFESLLPDDLHIGIGHQVMVMGYPRGFYDDTHNLPIVRDAAVSSPFGVPFKGMPCFVIDAHLHPGTSGSPVQTKPQLSWLDRFGSVRTGSFPPYLLGIQSGRWLFPVAKDEPSGLNVVWYASLLRDIIH